MSAKRTSDLILELIDLCLKGEPREQYTMSDDENRRRSRGYHDKLKRLRDEIDRRVPPTQDTRP